MCMNASMPRNVEMYIKHSKKGVQKCMNACMGNVEMYCTLNRVRRCMYACMGNVEMYCTLNRVRRCMNACMGNVEMYIEQSEKCV